MCSESSEISFINFFGSKKTTPSESVNNKIINTTDLTPNFNFKIEKSNKQLPKDLSTIYYGIISSLPVPEVLNCHEFCPRCNKEHKNLINLIVNTTMHCYKKVAVLRQNL